MDDQNTTTSLADTTKLTEWDNEPTVMDLKADLEEAKPTHDAQMMRIDGWLDNLYVRNGAKAKSGDGRSKYVPKLIRKQAEWRYPSLSEPFLSSPDLFDAQPVTWDDKKAAEQNSLVLNNQFTVKIDRQAFVDEYVRAAVDEGTAIVRVGWAYEEEVVLETAPIVEFYPDPSYAQMHEEIAQIRQTNPNQYTLDVPEEIRQAHELSIENGVPIRPEIVGEEEVEKVNVLKNHPTVEVCDPHNVVFDPTCNGDLSKANFIVFSFDSSMAELEATGLYQNLDKVNISNSSPLMEPDHATNSPDTFNFKDKPRQKLVVREYWGYWDISGTGVVEPIVAAWIGDTLVRLEESPFPDKKLPFVRVSYLPVRNSVYGEPDGELLEENQQLMGALSRGMIDIMGRSANGQTGIRKDMLDATNRRRFEKGQDYEFNQNVDPRQGVFMHTFPEIPQSVPLMIQSQHQDAESLTGVKAYANGISGASLGEVAAGVRGALDASSKRELGILRRLGRGLVEIGRKVMAMNAEFLSEEEVIRITNSEFVKVRRDDLKGEIDLRLTISTAEEDNQKAQELSFMLQTMGQNLDFSMNQILLSEIAKLRKMPELAKKIEEFQPQPDPMEQQQKQLEIQKLQAEIQNLNAQAQERMAGAQLDAAKAGNVQSDTDLKDLDFVEQESGVKQEREKELHSEQARANMALKREEARLKASMEKSSEKGLQGS